MGLVNLPMVGEVDLFPDHLEKAIFKKLWASVVSNMLEMEMTVAGVRMKMHPIMPPAASSEQAAARDIQGFLRRRQQRVPREASTATG
eukprot:1241836-Prymnesium_polylepis.1